MAQSDQSYSAGMMAVKQTPPEELAAAHWRQTQSLQALAERQDDELAALRAEVERQGEAIRRLVVELRDYSPPVDGKLMGGPAPLRWLAAQGILATLAAPAPDAAPEPMPDCPRCGNNRQVWRNQISGRLRCHRVGCEADVDAPAPDAMDRQAKCSWPDCGCAEARLCVAESGANDGAMAVNLPHRAPTPPADAPLPGPVAFAGRYGGLPAEVTDAIRAILQARAVGGLGYADASNCADALAAWARAQQQPALGDEVRAAMREACYLMQWASHGSGTLPMLANDLRDSAARLRELAGECGRGFATIPGWRAGEP